MYTKFHRTTTVILTIIILAKLYFKTGEIKPFHDLKKKKIKETYDQIALQKILKKYFLNKHTQEVTRNKETILEHLIKECLRKYCKFNKIIHIFRNNAKY